MEDYLKALYNLGEDEPGGTPAGSAGTTTGVAVLAERLRVTTASASAMVGRLARDGLVHHERYGGVALTEAGRTLAVEVVRRHRIVETYLVAHLGYSWDEVHDDAETLEHAVSARLLDRLYAASGRPLRDPHGDPIPTAAGVAHEPVTRPLLALGPGERGYVARVLDDPELLRWLTAQRLHLDTEIEVVEQRPLGGPLVVRADPDTDAARLVEVGLLAVGAIRVADAPPTPSDETADACPFPSCAHPGAAASGAS